MMLAGIQFASCQAIFMNVLGVKHAAAKIFPKLLNFEQYKGRIAQPQLRRRSTTIQICSLVTNHGCLAMTLGLAMTLKPTPNHPNGSIQRSNVKVLLTAFFDYNGVKHHEFLTQGHTVNTGTVPRSNAPIGRSNSSGTHIVWILHYNKAPAHTSMLTREFLAQKKNRNHALLLEKVITGDESFQISLHIKLNFLHKT